MAETTRGKRVRTMSLGEIRELAKLTRKHWGDGSVRSLLTGAGNYRPTLIVKALKRELIVRTAEEQRSFLAECAERGRLADLYDRAQAQRGDTRRAARV